MKWIEEKNQVMKEMEYKLNKILIIKGNIVNEIEADVIVNAANHALQDGGGVCGAIF